MTMIIQMILSVILIGEIILIALWLIARERATLKKYGPEGEVDLRLTYKRYMQLYPSANITYEQYKKLQVQRAYKKAVSSTKIKRMVR